MSNWYRRAHPGRNGKTLREPWTEDRSHREERTLRRTKITKERKKGGKKGYHQRTAWPVAKPTSSSKSSPSLENGAYLGSTTKNWAQGDLSRKNGKRKIEDKKLLAKPKNSGDRN